MKLGKTDFKISDVFSYEGNIQLWGKNSSVALNFPEDKPEGEYFDDGTGESYEIWDEEDLEGYEILP